MALSTKTISAKAKRKGSYLISQRSLPPPEFCRDQNNRIHVSSFQLPKTLLKTLRLILETDCTWYFCNKFSYRRQVVICCKINFISFRSYRKFVLLVCSQMKNFFAKEFFYQDSGDIEVEKRLMKLKMASNKTSASLNILIVCLKVG